MVEKVRSGQYEVGSIEGESREGDRIIGVISGEAANERSFEPFKQVIGVKSSKWYVYEVEELLVKERGVTTGTYVRLIASLVEECDTKSEAVDYAESRYTFD